MEIPLNASVECSDGVCGRSEYVLINPVNDQMTHLVVKGNSSPNTEYLVPVDSVTETKADTIQLRCSKAELEKMEPFIKTTYIEDKMPARNFDNAGVSMERDGDKLLPALCYFRKDIPDACGAPADSAGGTFGEPRYPR